MIFAVNYTIGGGHEPTASGSHRSNPFLQRRRIQISMFLSDKLAHAVASTTAHETGHLLGLVNEGYLGGTGGKHNRNTLINGWTMNAGRYTPSVYHLGSHPNRMRSWKALNAQYLQFILPKGTQ